MSELVPDCPDCGVNHSDNHGGFHDDECASHTWGPWSFSEVTPVEVRFCGRCGSMESQELRP